MVSVKRNVPKVVKGTKELSMGNWKQVTTERDYILNFQKLRRFYLTKCNKNIICVEIRHIHRFTNVNTNRTRSNIQRD